MWELTQKLKTKTLDHAIIENIITDFINKKYLSDVRFTESYITMRVGRGYGPIKIALELDERGIAEELIAEQLAMHKEHWPQLIAEAHRKKFRGKLPQDLAERAKHMRFLQYRGFDFKDINRVLKNADE